MFWWFISTLIVNILYITAALNWPIHHAVSVYVLDVGQGDSTLITTTSGRVILVDAGPAQNVLAPLSQSLPPFVKHIDLLILTHPHADHIDGALALINRYRVGAILMTAVNYNSSNFDRLMEIARHKDVLLFQAQADYDWLIDDGLVINILFPFSSLNQLAFKNVNNSSIVFMLQAKAKRILFTGDMELELENIMTTYYKEQLAANYLKVGHHGSKTSSSQPFLRYVYPQEMWVSVGKNNNYHHPDQATIQRLESIGTVFRTDKVGTIEKNLIQ